MMRWFCQNISNVDIFVVAILSCSDNDSQMNNKYCHCEMSKLKPTKIATTNMSMCYCHGGTYTKASAELQDVFVTCNYPDTGHVTSPRP